MAFAQTLSSPVVMNSHLFAVVLLVAAGTLCSAADLYHTESALLTNLLVNYSKEIAPQVMSNKPVNVSLRLSLDHILELNEKKGIMSTSLFPTMWWVDERLAWDKESDLLEMMSVEAGKVWVPNIDVQNSMVATEDVKSPRLLIYKNGTVFYTTHKVVTTPCAMDLTNFPFDAHYCHVYIGSWTAPNNVMNLISEETGNTLTFYDNHKSWKLKEVSVTERKQIDVVTGLNYSRVLLSVHVSRAGNYYYRLFVSPAAVCLFVIPVVHFLPPSSNEKLTLGGLMLVAATVMFEMVDDFFPAYSLGNVPYILHYYTFLLITVFISLLLSCMSVMIGTGDSKSARVPRFLRICCLDRLGYICCARGRTSRYDYELLHLEKALRFSALRQSSRQDDEHELEETQDDGEDAGVNNHVAGATRDDGMKEVLKTLINELQYARYKEQIKSEWLQLAMVIDRTGAFILLTLSVIVTAVISLHSSP